MQSVLFVDSAGMDQHAGARLSGVLNEAEYAKSRQFVHSEDRDSYVIAHALKRIVLSSLVGVAMEGLEFTYSDFGKPSLLNHDVHFNLSHSRGMVAFVWSRSNPVGIDVEHLGHHDYDEGVAKMVLSDAELCEVNAVKDRQRTFLKFWTMKEAVAKAEGKGINMDFRQLVSINAQVAIESTEWKVDHYYPSPKHVAAVATSVSFDDELAVCKVMRLDELIYIAEQESVVEW